MPCIDRARTEPAPDAPDAESPAEMLRALERDLRALADRRRRFQLARYYPDEGPLRRALYAKHLEFFKAGARYRERCAMAANRVGKTEGMGGYETTLHLTGRYPAWWEGRRFTRPIEAWAAGKRNETTRDVVQAKLVGPPENAAGWGTGLIPGDDLGTYTRKAGVANLLDTIRVRHHDAEGRFDGWSVLGLKSYQQGRSAFEGTSKQVIWLDEEPPADIYGECLTRTADTTGTGRDGGLIYLTFTPLEGLSEVVMQFMPGEMRPADADGLR